MITGYTPFTGRNQYNLLENIMKGDYYFPKTVKLSLKGLSFMNSCLQFEGNSRPTLAALSKYEYIDGSDSLDKSSADNLFLSYHPESETF